MTYCTVLLHLLIVLVVNLIAFSKYFEDVSISNVSLHFIALFFFIQFNFLALSVF